MARSSPPAIASSDVAASNFGRSGRFCPAAVDQVPGLRDEEADEQLDGLLRRMDDDTVRELLLRALGDQRWARLAEAREPSDPAGALSVYLRLVESSLRTADKRAYRAATKQLKQARRAAAAAGLSDEFGEHLAALREQHRRRPTLIAMLDKAGLQ